MREEAQTITQHVSLIDLTIAPAVSVKEAGLIAGPTYLNIKKG
jgi:hypothetical protein